MFPNPFIRDRVLNYLRFLVFFIIAAWGIWLAWENRVELQAILSNEREIQVFVDSLGWLGPLVLIATNIAQMVIAPIPGYAVYILAGFLYGPLWGGIWGSIGLISGGMLSMWLSRRYGRSLVVRMVGESHLDHWEEMIHSDSVIVWGIILLSPVGDTPYYLAGLSHVSYTKIFVLTFITRVPITFLVVALGKGALEFNWWQLTAIVAILATPLVVFLLYREQIFCWLRAKSVYAARNC